VAFDAPSNVHSTPSQRRIIMAQMEGSGRGALGAYNASGYNALLEFIEENPMRNGDAWLQKLMLKDPLLGVRLMEVRSAYAESDFEWDNCKKVAVEGIVEANTRIMRQHAVQQYEGALQDPSGEDTAS
jgi:hypothetical protein